MKEEQIYYDWSVIDGYKCPVKIVISQRGLGKTFGKKRLCIERFITKEKRFIYVVETDEMVKELCRNNGEKFFADIVEYYKEQNTSKKRYFYNKLTELVTDEEEGQISLFEEKRKSVAKLFGSTIYINGKTAGYILAMNAFGEIKRNSFVGVGTIIIDEFITEKLDKTALENPRKVASIIQSVARLKDIEIYMLGNAIRYDDPILSRMGIKLDKGYGIYKRYDENGLVAVLDFVDSAKYASFNKRHNRSTAGRFSHLVGEENEEKNAFITDLPDSRRLRCISNLKNGFRIHIVKENEIVTISEQKDGFYAVLPFNTSSTAQLLYCMTEKEQGFKFGRHCICDVNLRKALCDLLKADKFKYYSEVEYAKLKYIIKGA